MHHTWKKVIPLLPNVNVFSLAILGILVNYTLAEHVLSRIANQLNHICLGLNVPLLKPTGGFVLLFIFDICICFLKGPGKFLLRLLLVYFPPVRADVFLTTRESPISETASVLPLEYLPWAVFIQYPCHCRGHQFWPRRHNILFQSSSKLGSWQGQVTPLSSTCSSPEP